MCQPSAQISDNTHSSWIWSTPRHSSVPTSVCQVPALNDEANEQLREDQEAAVVALTGTDGGAVGGRTTAATGCGVDAGGDDRAAVGSGAGGGAGEGTWASCSLVVLNPRVTISQISS